MIFARSADFAGRDPGGCGGCDVGSFIGTDGGRGTGGITGVIVAGIAPVDARTNGHLVPTTTRFLEAFCASDLGPLGGASCEGVLTISGLYDGRIPRGLEEGPEGMYAIDFKSGGGDGRFPLGRAGKFRLDESVFGKEAVCDTDVDSIEADTGDFSNARVLRLV